MAPNRATYEALPRSSAELSDADEALQRFKDKPLFPSRSLFRKLRRIFRFCRPLYIFIASVLFISWQLVFNGSYIDKGFEMDEPGSVYIAANIVNGDLISGDWGKSLKGLAELIGKEKVFVSVYGSPKVDLDGLKKELNGYETSIVAEEDNPLDMQDIPRTRLPTGESRIKRIAYLAAVRNKALEPIYKSEKKWDKVLFINDVFFEPKDAARLLWGTNLNKDGKSEYKAVCAADFISSWKYYDTFATRDSEGYGIGVPIFPWFAGEGKAISRNDVLAGKDAVRVKSCWGGMIAFDGRYFQNTTAEQNSQGTKGPQRPELPLKFRSEEEPFWGASECCLIHADIIASAPFSPLADHETKDPWDTGIYMNPFVRVSYDKRTYKWIGTAKRFERLFAIPQAIINRFAHMPVWNPRRLEKEGELIKDRRWVPLNPGSESVPDTKTGEKEVGGEEGTWQGSGVEKERRGILTKRTRELKSKEYWENEGFYEEFDRIAGRGGFCGTRQLLVVKEGVEGGWDDLAVPPL